MVSFNFMVNAFYVLCGIVCIWITVLFVLGLVKAIMKEFKKGK